MFIISFTLKTKEIKSINRTKNYSNEFTTFLAMKEVTISLKWPCKNPWLKKRIIIIIINYFYNKKANIN